MALRSDVSNGREQQRREALLRPSTSSGEGLGAARHLGFAASQLASVSEAMDRPSTSSAAATPGPITPSIIPPRAPRRTGMPKLALPSRPSSSSAAMNGRPPLGQLTSTPLQHSNARPALSLAPDSIHTTAAGGFRQTQQASAETNLSVALPSGPSYGGLSSDADSVYEGSAGHHFPAPGETASGIATGSQHTIYPDTVPHVAGSRNPQVLTNDLRRAIGRLSFEGEERGAEHEQDAHSTASTQRRNKEPSVHRIRVETTAAPQIVEGQSGYDTSRSGESKSHTRPAASSQGDTSSELQEESELILEGNLESLDRLGEGASGEVRKARYKPTGIVMAMKTINTSPIPDIHRQILRELAFNRTCRSEYIVRYFGAYLTNEDTSIVIGMELCEGGSLDSIYKRVKQRNGRMGEKVLAKIAESGLRGLAYLHERKIIHRDIKPSNILVTRNGAIKLCDFGVSGELIDSMAGTFTGTSFYMAPERIQNLPYNITSDVWSLGLTVLELASNRFPFPAEGEPPLGPIDLLTYVITMKSPELKDDPVTNIKWTRAFRDFIEHCLEKDGKKRYGPVKMLNHPWIKRSQTRVPPVDVGRFVAEVWGWPLPERTEAASPSLDTAASGAPDARLAPKPSVSRPGRHASTIIAEDVEVPGLGRVPSIRQAPKPFGAFSTPTAAQFPTSTPASQPQQDAKVASSLSYSPSARRKPTSSASLLAEPRGSIDARGIDIEGRTLDDRRAARRREADVGLVGSPEDNFDARRP